MLFIKEFFAMSITLPINEVVKAYLISPMLNVRGNSCFSFLIYFNISSVTVTIGKLDSADFDVSKDFTTIGILRYPFLTSLYQEGDSSSLFNINMKLPNGSYHVIFIAEGKGGSVAIWNIRTIYSACNISSRFI